jgi:HK97 family phage major capsid protein
MARSYVATRAASLEDVVKLATDPRALAETFSANPMDVLRGHAAALAKGDPMAVLGALLQGAFTGARRPRLDGLAAFLADLASVDADRRAAASAKDKALRNALAERIPSSGGFLVGEEWSQALLVYSLEYAIVRPRAVAIPSENLRLPIPTIDDTSHASSVFGGIVANWTEEGAALTGTVPTLGRQQLEAKKLVISLPNLPSELVDDAFAWQIYTERALPAAVGWYEDAAFINGDGVGQPQGALNSPCAIEITRAGSNAVGLADIAKMACRLLPQCARTAVWLCSPDVLLQLLEIYLNIGSATTGTTAPSGWLTVGGDGQWRLMGRTLYPTEHVPALGTRGDLALIDFGEYLIEDRVLMEAAASRHHSYGSDQVDFRLINRSDGRHWRQNPFTPANGSQTLSSVIVLK